MRVNGMKGQNEMLGMKAAASDGKPNSKAMDRAIRAAAEGDRDALRLLYLEGRRAVYAYALSMLKSPQDAEDVLHDCFLRAWEHAAAYQSQGKPMAWLLTITRNLCLSRLRERKRIGILPDDYAELPAPQGLSPEERLALDATLSALSARERQIVVLHAVADLKHREIAVMLDMPLGTVLSQYRRALKKLQTALEQE